MADGRFSDGRRRRPFVAEIATAAGVAVIVATAVVGVGLNRDADTDAERAASAGQGAGPETTAPTSDPPDDGMESPPDEPGVAAKVTKIDLTVDPADYVGPCPVTITVTASIVTDTGPVTAHYRWVRDGEPGEDETVRFGGPGPQKVTVTDTIEAVDDLAVSRSLRVSSPNEFDAEPVDVAVTCTPTAATSLDLDSICATPHTITFHGSITVPHGPMTVKYVWERSDGAIAPTQSLDFPAGGEQTMSVDNDWTVSQKGEFSQRIKILEPHEVTSNWSTFTMEC